MSNSTGSNKSAGSPGRGAWWPTAAVIAGLAVVLASSGMFLARTEVDATYHTPVGRQIHQTLSDGTVIDLNTHTRVRIRFTADRRQIFLDHGELLLSVAHDASRPLDVIAGLVTARAVGTKFSVHRHDDQRVETLVTEGRVLVLRNRDVLGIPLEPMPIDHTLVAGEKVMVDGHSSSFTRVSEKQTRRTLMWTTGKVAFEGEPLADVVEELNRYAVRQLVIRDPSIGAKSIGGGYDTANAEAYARALSRYFGDSALPLVPPRSAQ